MSDNLVKFPNIQELGLTADKIDGADVTDDWHMLLHRDPKSMAIKRTAHNLNIIIRHAYPEKFTFDRFNSRTYVGNAQRHLEDADINAVLLWLSGTYQLEYTANQVRQGIDTVARANGYDSLIQYFRSIEWDGVDRLDTWLTRYLGVPNTPLDAVFGRLWLIGCAARALQPGCKLDHMLVLQGAQGLGKSTALEILYYADKQWFMSSHETVGTRDFYATIQGRWGVELCEMDGAKRAEQRTLTAMLSTATDVWVRKYDAYDREYKRRACFIGTSNPGEGRSWFSDTSGGRRFWVVSCRDKIDLAGLREDRDQLWAEAAAKYIEGETWYLTDAEERTAQQERLNELLFDVVGAEEIQAAVNLLKLKGITRPVTTDVLAAWQGEHYRPACVTHVQAESVKRVLTALGYESKTARDSEGIARRRWVHVSERDRRFKANR